MLKSMFLGHPPIGTFTLLLYTDLEISFNVELHTGLVLLSQFGCIYNISVRFTPKTEIMFEESKDPYGPSVVGEPLLRTLLY